MRVAEPAFASIRSIRTRSTRRSAGAIASIPRRSAARGPGSHTSARVTFNERDSRPHMTIAIAEHGPGQGVIEADVDLRSVVDAIARARIGACRLRVRRRRTRHAHRPSGHEPRPRATRASPTLPQVRAALTGAATARADVVTSGRDPDGGRGSQRLPTGRSARLVGLRRGAAQRGVRADPVGDLANSAAPRRLPPPGDRDERAAGPQPRQADRVDPGRRSEGRLRCPRSADRDLER